MWCSPTVQAKLKIPLKAKLARLWGSKEVRFLVVGAVNTALSLVIFTFLAWMFQNSWSSYLIVTVAAIISLLTNYSTQRYFVWRSNSKVWGELPRYAISSGFIYLLNLALIWLFHDRVGLKLIPAQYLSVLLATVASYFILKYFAFTRKA